MLAGNIRLTATVAISYVYKQDKKVLTTGKKYTVTCPNSQKGVPMSHTYMNLQGSGYFHTINKINNVSDQRVHIHTHYS